MFGSNKILGIIPARGGSKGLPGKNIRNFSGKPLIAWTIEQALSSEYLDKVIVSTDSREIAEVSLKYGAEVPFMRPDILAADEARTIDVIYHAIDWFHGRGEIFELIMLLQPISPLRKVEDIEGCIQSLFSLKAKAMVSVCQVDHPACWVNTLPPDLNMKYFLKTESMNKNRQQSPVSYRINGAIYLSYYDYIKIEGSFFGQETFAYIMPRERSIDIDDELDFRMAEFLNRNI